MSILRSVALVLLFCSLYACTDSTAPTDPDNNNETGGPNDFAIVSVDKDTAMWGDTVTVKLRNVHAGSFSVFLHTTPMILDSVWRDSLGNAGFQFYLRENASSGRIRVYQHDTLEAKGNYSLVVHPEFRFKSTAESFLPAFGYTDDLITIKGWNLPNDLRDVSVQVGDVNLRIESHDERHIYARVTSGVRSDSLVVRIHNRIFRLGMFQKLEPSGQLLQEGSIERVRLSTFGLIGQTRWLKFRGKDTTVEADSQIPNSNFELEFKNVQVTNVGDSVVAFGDHYDGVYTNKLTLRLKRETGSSVSGVIEVGRIREHDSESSDETWYTIRLDRMRWSSALSASTYTLYAFSNDIRKQLTQFSHHQQNPAFHVQTLTYEGGNPDAYILIDLIP